MNRLSFRRAKEGDLSTLVALLADDMLGRAREDADPHLNPRYAAAFAAITADPNQFLAVCESDGAIVGCLQLTFIPGLSHRGALRGQIESVRVAAGSRNMGIGRRMIAWAIDECRRRRCDILQLSTSKSRIDAHRFYAALGFEASHEGMKLPL